MSATSDKQQRVPFIRRPAARIAVSSQLSAVPPAAGQPSALGRRGSAGNPQSAPARRDNPQCLTPDPRPLTPDLRGFTLTELIVVMAVIVLLVAIAIPSFENITKSNQFLQIDSQVTTLFTSVYARSQEERTGILFLRARPVDADNDSGGYDTGFGDAFGFQRAIPVTFSPYEVHDAAGNSVTDPSGPAAPNGMTYEVFYGVQPYARPLEGQAPVDLPEDVWAAPDFVDDTLLRQPGGLDVSIPATEFADSWLVDKTNADDSRIDRFFIVFAAGGENIEMQAADPDVTSAPHKVDNTLTYRPNANAVFTTSAGTDQWVMSRNPISARGVIVYDRKAMLARRNTTDRRDFLLEQGRPLYLSRFGGVTLLGQEQ